jgi:hypothetical protein
VGTVVVAALIVLSACAVRVSTKIRINMPWLDRVEGTVRSLLLPDEDVREVRALDELLDDNKAGFEWEMHAVPHVGDGAAVVRVMHVVEPGVADILDVSPGDGNGAVDALVLGLVEVGDEKGSPKLHHSVLAILPSMEIILELIRAIHLRDSAVGLRSVDREEEQDPLTLLPALIPQTHDPGTDFVHGRPLRILDGPVDVVHIVGLDTHNASLESVSGAIIDWLKDGGRTYVWWELIAIVILGLQRDVGAVESLAKIGRQSLEAQQRMEASVVNLLLDDNWAIGGCLLRHG